MIRQFFAPVWVKLATAVFGLLLAALAWLWIGWSREEAETERLRNAFATEEARHAVTRQSVLTLEAEFYRLVHEGEVREKRLREAMTAVQEDTARLQAEANRIEREGLGSDYVSRLRKAGI